MRRSLVVTILMLSILGACGDDTPGSSPGSTDSGATPNAARSSALPQGCVDLSDEDDGAPVEMRDFEFDPACFQIKASQGLSLSNKGELKHNFSVEGFEGIDVDVESADENNTEATGLGIGTYRFFCKYHRESNDMEGRLLIRLG